MPWTTLGVGLVGCGVREGGVVGRGRSVGGRDGLVRAGGRVPRRPGRVRVQRWARTRGDRDGDSAEAAPLHEVVDRRLGEFCIAIRDSHAARVTRTQAGQGAGEGVTEEDRGRGAEAGGDAADTGAPSDARRGAGGGERAGGEGEGEGERDARGTQKSPMASDMVKDAWGQVLRMWTEKRFSQARTSLQILGALVRSGSILGAGASLPLVGKFILLGVPLLATVGVVVKSLLETVAREAAVFFPRFVAAVAVLAAVFAIKSVLEAFIATLASKRLVDGQQEGVGYLTLEIAGVFFACVVVLELMFQRAASVVLPIAGIAVAIGAKDVIATMMSGIFLTTSRPFQKGDVVWVDGYSGVVLSQDLRYTVLQVKRAGPPDVDNGILDDHDAEVMMATGPSVSSTYGAGEGVHMLVPNSRFVRGGFLVSRGRATAHVGSPADAKAAVQLV